MNISIKPLRRDDALVIVDVQQDFLPGGALGVSGGDAVIAPLNACAKAFAALGLPVFATRDWHPPNHCSFLEQGGPWPPHCVAGTTGAEFPAALELSSSAQVISKAQSAASDAYSAFQGTDLADRLRNRGCRRVFMGGLATEYCVRATGVDALAEGFSVVVLEDAVRPVELAAGDGARAIAELRGRGALIARSEAVLA